MNPTTNQQQAAQQQIEPTTQQPPQTMTVNDAPPQSDTSPSVDNTPPPSYPKTAPKFDLVNKPFVITPGDSSTPTRPAAANLSEPKLNRPISDGFKHLVNSAKSAWMDCQSSQLAEATAHGSRLAIPAQPRGRGLPPTIGRPFLGVVWLRARTALAMWLRRGETLGLSQIAGFELVAIDDGLEAFGLAAGQFHGCVPRYGSVSARA